MSGAPEPAADDAHLVRRGMRVRVVRDVFEIIAFTAAGIWAIWTFWYQAKYEPEHEKPLIEWTISLTREGVRAKDGMIAVRAHVVGSNKGKATEHLVGLTVNLFGGHVLRADAGARPVVATARNWDVNRSAITETPVFLASQGERWGGDFRSFVHPDQESQSDFLFWVDPGDFDYLTGHLYVRDESDEHFDPALFEVQAVDGGTDGLRVAATDACRQSKGCFSGSFDTSTQLPLWPRGDDPPMPASATQSTPGTPR